jgi:beta-glucosidase/6-phospho-beta-glucosidase/beta-galactosidase
MIAATQHDLLLDEDYERLRIFNIRTVREGIRWHTIDKGGRYDFSSLSPFVKAAQKDGIEVIWSLCHYGWPDDLDLFSPRFIDRFEKYCTAVVRYISDNFEGTQFYSPFNEISFVAYAIGTKAFMHPYAAGRSHEVKDQLIRATIAGTEAIWRINPRARTVHIDPMFNVVPPLDKPELAETAHAQTRSQYEAADLICGKERPELGGHPRYLDIVGVNYYHSNQWEFPENRLRWEDSPRDNRWLPLHNLLARAKAYYERPIFIAETSHFGAGRAKWITEIASEVCTALESGVDIQGICLYPLLDRPDWEDSNHWHNSGLWDVRLDKGRSERVLNNDYAEAVIKAQQVLQTNLSLLKRGSQNPASASLAIPTVEALAGTVGGDAV